MSELFERSLEIIKTPNGYVQFLFDFEKQINSSVDAVFGGQVNNRFGVPVCLVFGDPKTKPGMKVALKELLRFCLHEGHGIEVLDGQGLAVSIPYGLLVSLSLHGSLLHRPCQLTEKAPIQAEDYALQGLSDDDVTPAARFFMNQLLSSIIKDRPPSALYFEGHEPSPFQALVFNIYQEDLPSEKHAAHIESILRWFLPPSYLVRIYKRNPELEAELETAEPLVKTKVKAAIASAIQ